MKKLITLLAVMFLSVVCHANYGGAGIVNLHADIITTDNAEAIQVATDTLKGVDEQNATNTRVSTETIVTNLRISTETLATVDTTNATNNRVSSTTIVTNLRVSTETLAAVTLSTATESERLVTSLRLSTSTANAYQTYDNTNKEVSFSTSTNVAGLTIGGAGTALPTGEYIAGTIFYDTDNVCAYISTETVAGVQSWKELFTPLVP